MSVNKIEKTWSILNFRSIKVIRRNSRYTFDVALSSSIRYVFEIGKDAETLAAVINVAFC